MNTISQSSYTELYLPHLTCVLPEGGAYALTHVYSPWLGRLHNLSDNTLFEKVYPQKRLQGPETLCQGSPWGAR